MDSTCHSSILCLFLLLLLFPSNPVNGTEINGIENININNIVDSENTGVVVDQIESEINTKFDTMINETISIGTKL